MAIVGWIVESELWQFPSTHKISPLLIKVCLKRKDWIMLQQWRNDQLIQEHLYCSGNYKRYQIDIFCNSQSSTTVPEVNFNEL